MEAPHKGAQRASLGPLRFPIGLVLAVLALTFTAVATAAAPVPSVPMTVVSSTRAALCDGVSARTAATSTATKKTTIAAGTTVTTTGGGGGAKWRVTCAGRTVSGSTWYRISRINGKTVSSLYRVSYLYAATGLFKTAAISVAPACAGAVLRTAAGHDRDANHQRAVGHDADGDGDREGGLVVHAVHRSRRSPRARGIGSLLLADDRSCRCTASAASTPPRVCSSRPVDHRAHRRHRRRP